VVAPPTPNDAGILAHIAESLGRIESRLDALEQSQADTQVVAETAAVVASDAAATAVEATEEAEEAGEAAIEVATEAVAAAAEQEQEPRREHWFFRPYRVTHD
jgi:hypothetical protein